MKTTESKDAKPKKLDLQLRCIFTEKERLEKGKQVAEAIREVATEEDNLATVKSQFKSKIEGVQARINLLSEHITSGYEYRMVPCEVRLDTPGKGDKTTVRLDTGDVVSIDKMTAAEMQHELPLGATVDGGGNVSVAADGKPAPEKV